MMDVRNPAHAISARGLVGPLLLLKSLHHEVRVMLLMGFF